MEIVIRRVLNLNCEHFPSIFGIEMFRENIRKYKADPKPPRIFRMSWKRNDARSNKDIFEMYREGLASEIYHLGSFQQFDGTKRKKNFVDIWIMSNLEEWQILTIEEARNARVFLLQTPDSRADFYRKLIDILSKLLDPSDIIGFRSPSILFDTFYKLNSLKQIKEELELLLDVLDNIRKFPRFEEFPARVKIQIIRKCSPKTYVRLRQSCLSADEFCEENKHELNIYLENNWLELEENLADPNAYHQLVVKRKGPYSTEPTVLRLDTMFSVRSCLSGFAFSELCLRKSGKPQFDVALRRLLAMASHLKFRGLKVANLTAKQVNHILGGFGKIRSIHIGINSKEFQQMLDIDAVKIWKRDVPCPNYFKISWKWDDKYSNGDVFQLYSQGMLSDAIHLGTFWITYTFPLDVWIMEKRGKWQMITIADARPIHIFILESVDSKDEFTGKFVDLLAKIWNSYEISDLENFVKSAWLLENFKKLKSLEEIKEEFNFLVAILYSIIKFPRFLQLPLQIRIQIIRKCSTKTYTRLRRTCHFLDESCEESRKFLNVWEENRRLILALDDSTQEYILIVKNKDTDRIKILGKLEDTGVIKKAVSGVAFTRTNHEKNSNLKFEEALSRLFEATPHLKIRALKLYDFTREQVQRVLEAPWKIGKIHFDYSGERLEILEMDEIKKLSAVSYAWDNEKLHFGELEIANFSRGRHAISLAPRNFIKSLDVLKIIVQNWKEIARFPEYFQIKGDELVMDYIDANISHLYYEIMAMEAEYLGEFLIKDERHRDGRGGRGKYNIWIRKDRSGWQMVSIRRYIENLGPLGRTTFRFQVDESKLDLVSKLIAFLPRIFRANRIINSISRHLDLGSFRNTLMKLDTVEEIKKGFNDIVKSIRVEWKIQEYE